LNKTGEYQKEGHQNAWRRKSSRVF